MAKNQNTFAKLQRERKKKEKAQMKRERRLIRKLSGNETEPTETEDDNSEQIPSESNTAIDNEQDC